jgi:hypothetical protein
MDERCGVYRAIIDRCEGQNRTVRGRDSCSLRNGAGLHPWRLNGAGFMNLESLNGAGTSRKRDLTNGAGTTGLGMLPSK